MRSGARRLREIYTHVARHLPDEGRRENLTDSGHRTSPSRSVRVDKDPVCLGAAVGFEGAFGERAARSASSADVFAGFSSAFGFSSPSAFAAFASGFSSAFSLPISAFGSFAGVPPPAPFRSSLMSSPF